MNLGLCIANLLKRHQAVEVPGIGVFQITRMPAVYDDAEQVIHPPARHVELNVGEGRGFPITAYLRAERQVDEAKARQMLGRAVADIMETMSRNGRVLLDGLGYLLADGASLVLKPFDTGGLDWKSIKLPAPIYSPEASAPEVEVIASQTAEEPLVEDAVVIEATDSLSLTDDTDYPVEPVIATANSMADTPESETRGSGARVWGWVAGVAALLIAAATWTWYQQPEWLERTGITRSIGAASSGEGESANQRPTAQGDAVVVDSAAAAQQMSAIDSAVVDSNAASLAATESVSAEPPPPAKPAVTYEIIVGSFATMAQADKYVAQMKAKGYELHAIDSRMPGNRKKISWGSYATEEEAYRELARVQKTFEPGAWIAKVDNAD